MNESILIFLLPNYMNSTLTHNEKIDRLIDSHTYHFKVTKNFSNTYEFGRQKYRHQLHLYNIFEMVSWATIH